MSIKQQFSIHLKEADNKLITHLKNKHQKEFNTLNDFFNTNVPGTKIIIEPTSTNLKKSPKYNIYNSFENISYYAINSLHPLKHHIKLFDNNDALIAKIDEKINPPAKIFQNNFSVKLNGKEPEMLNFSNIINWNSWNAKKIIRNKNTFIIYDNNNNVLLTVKKHFNGKAPIKGFYLNVNNKNDELYAIIFVLALHSTELDKIEPKG